MIHNYTIRYIYRDTVLKLKKEECLDLHMHILLYLNIK